MSCQFDEPLHCTFLTVKLFTFPFEGDLCVYLQGADAISTGRILETVVRMCFEAKQFDLLNENIIQLTKKRGQLKQVVVFSLLCHLHMMLQYMLGKHPNNASVL